MTTPIIIYFQYSHLLTLLSATNLFEVPDGKDRICCHNWLQGKTIVAFDHLPLYAETREQLGIEPPHFENGKWSVNEPTWTEQKVIWNTK